MKRFLSLVLSALFVFQLGNASCDAGSQWDKRKVICADIYGNSVQPQVFTVPVSQQQPIINVTAPEQPAPVVNVIPTPQTIAIQQPEMEQYFNIKVDATTTADKVTSALKCAGYLFLAVGGVWLAVKLWPLLKFLLKNIFTISGAATAITAVSKSSTALSLIGNFFKVTGITQVFSKTMCMITHRGCSFRQ